MDGLMTELPPEAPLAMPDQRLRDRFVDPAAPVGGSQAIAIDWQNSVLTGASDPRKDGCAIGY